ncbi:hypothetical protein ZIOFF_002585 [Zingiber officinale]|uniref:Uncharacterized protein n=1 Tax=Zingiber officinale TaxID=94328 RepID=A0A8J5HWI1_ZINOF|nr:hypothetical protein ZIOFF_002585 [Zingiber officinale]
MTAIFPKVQPYGIVEYGFSPTLQRFPKSMANGAPSWADQWGAGGLNDDDDYDDKNKESGKDNKKMEKAKAFASSSFGKAKAAAAVGASKAKSGTTTGIKWMKAQYQKRTSK